MKYFLFSDVHGEYTALMNSLDAAGFNVVNNDHMLIGVGDYFDRGPENDRVYMFLKIMKELGRIKLIRGNHDDMLLNFLGNGIIENPFDRMRSTQMFVNDIIYNGLNMTVAQLAGQSEISNNLSVLIDGADSFRNQIKVRNPQLLNILTSMTNKIVIDNYVITHAGFTLKDDIMVVDNWAHTEKMIENNQHLLDPNLTYVFGHWHAQRLNKKFNVKADNINKFVYKNLIGIDAKTNLTKEVTIHVIETDTNIF
jgi:serine/threonine protein phosphatase 1